MTLIPMTPETDLALRNFLNALTDLVKHATEALKRDMAQEGSKRVK